MRRADWLSLVVEWCGGADCLPASPPGVGLRPEVGELYPWGVVAAHASSVAFAHAIDGARRVIDAADVMGAEWRIACSGGKDSTALALLLAEEGWRPGIVSVKDDLDYPGEDAYVRHLAWWTGNHAAVLSPDVSLRAWLRECGASLIEDLHGRAAELSAKHFHGVLDAHRAAEGYNGVFLGLRAAESATRTAARAANGTAYRRADGLHVASPLADWSALDVHAMLQSRGAPILPVYACVEPGADPMAIRKSWWVAGGGMASHGHYGWLRRWWPALYEQARAIDPNVERVA